MCGVKSVIVIGLSLILGMEGFIVLFVVGFIQQKKFNVKIMFDKVRKRNLESEEAIERNKEVYAALCKDCKKKYRKTLPKLLYKKDKEAVIDKLIESLCFLCKEKVT